MDLFLEQTSELWWIAFWNFQILAFPIFTWTFSFAFRCYFWLLDLNAKLNSVFWVWVSPQSPPRQVPGNQFQGTVCEQNFVASPISTLLGSAWIRRMDIISQFQMLFSNWSATRSSKNLWAIWVSVILASVSDLTSPFCFLHQWLVVCLHLLIWGLWLYLVTQLYCKCCSHVFDFYFIYCLL